MEKNKCPTCKCAPEQVNTVCSNPVHLPEHAKVQSVIEELGYIIYQMYDGDIVDNAMQILQDLGLVDENYEWIYVDED